MKEEPLTLLNSTICIHHMISLSTKRIVAVIEVETGMVLYGVPTTGDNYSSLRKIINSGHKVLGSSMDIGINDDVYWCQREEFVVVARMTPLEYSLERACVKIKEEIGL